MKEFYIGKFVKFPSLSTFEWNYNLNTIQKNETKTEPKLKKILKN